MTSKSAFWLFWALSALLVSAPVFAIGGKVSIIEFSTLGRVLIATAAAVAGIALAVWLVRTSKSGSPDSSLVSMRQLRPARWLVSILVLTAACAAIVAFCAGLWIGALIRNIPGKHVSMQGQVIRVSHSGPSTRYCRYLVDVKLHSNAQLRICEEFGFIDRRIPPGLENLKVGDGVVVSMTSTALGTSAVIVN